MLRKIFIGFCVLILLALGVYQAVMRGFGGDYSDPGEISSARRPLEVDTARTEVQRRAHPGHSQDQILFGDLHVHTTYSTDAFLFSLPIFQGEGAHPPADACDFARYCSALDFWSINDHAELITPAQWTETIDSIRQCNAAAGDPANPDVVAYLGWEWTQMSPKAETYFGHKNVVLRDTDDPPARPIGAGRSVLNDAALGLGSARFLLAATNPGKLERYINFNQYVTRAQALALCPEGVPVRELPADCLDGAETPEALYAKLDEWGQDHLVIPHGTAWGIHAPPRTSLRTQLTGNDADAQRQSLFEVFSGHGNAERWVDIEHVSVDSNGMLVCPEPKPGFEPCCWRAGELIRERCGDAPAAECEARVERAQQLFVNAGSAMQRYGIVPGSTPEEWGTCGTVEGLFSQAYIYRPEMSAQFGLAISDFSNPKRPVRFRYGLIGSSDNHKARGGSGYKEFGRKAMSDAWGFTQGAIDNLVKPQERSAEARDPADLPPLPALVAPERGASFYYTGGLVGVHASGRDRDSIFDALSARQVYGTSGDRMLLWFDLIGENGERHPMGSEVQVGDAPRFEVRAVGALEQKPGCPEHVARDLGAERMQRLCLDECYHPGEARRRIDRIEIVRIRPQVRPDEPIGGLIDDPWKVFACEDSGEGCSASFSDAEFPPSGRPALYYARALQEPTPTVAADPLRCVRDAAGDCISTRPCYASGPKFDPSDECRADAPEHAWSSPIFVERM